MTTLNITNFIWDVSEDVLANGSTPRPQRPVQTPGSVAKPWRGETDESH